MEDIFVAIVMMIVIFSLIPLYIWRRRLDSSQPHQHEEEPQEIQRERAVRAGNTRRMRRRPAASSAPSTSSTHANIEETSGGSDNEEAADGWHSGKASKKKEKKQKEREAQRQAEEAARDSRRTKQDRYEEMRRKKDEEREAYERKLEEEAKARQAKEEETAALEFEQWKGEFSVDAEGTTENEVQDGSQGLLFDFVEYIKKHKCVPLEDLAAEFKLRTQDCINRINSLETMGRLSGVMDDRGKYIYISLEEMKAVADYIRREGRVSISHLASKSNQFIDLEPKAPVAEDISSIEDWTGNRKLFSGESYIDYSGKERPIYLPGNRKLFSGESYIDYSGKERPIYLPLTFAGGQSYHLLGTAKMKFFIKVYRMSNW